MVSAPKSTKAEIARLFRSILVKTALPVGGIFGSLDGLESHSSTWAEREMKSLAVENSANKAMASSCEMSLIASILS